MAHTWRAAQKADRRDQYLSAAATLFADRGFRAVSIDDLGAAVGMSGPALYRHFRSKDAMLEELLLGVSERLLDGYRSIRDERADDARMLDDLIDFHVGFALAEPDVIRLQDRELTSLSPTANQHVRHLQRQYLEGWGEVVAALRPAVSAQEREVRLHAAFGVLNSTPYNQLSQEGLGQVLADSARAVLLR